MLFEMPNLFSSFLPLFLVVVLWWNGVKDLLLILSWKVGVVMVGTLPPGLPEYPVGLLLEEKSKLMRFVFFLSF